VRLEEGTQTVRLDRGRILDATEHIVGSEGVRARTMRRIGSELGADPTAIYRRFRNKEALLTCLAERMFASEPELDPDDPWQEQLRVHMVISHDLAVVRQITDEAIVMQRGRVVERGATLEVLDDPQDPYTQLLRASVPHAGWKPVRRRGRAAARTAIT
jgi:AcrR family transcriptional regulator